mmetsp:Transcript_35625/g.76856  ORF Transcript_35625/g.76856 Transcript_35625/m.76856 type:complete len:91 (+) Transcript_35625:88-360(+)
MASAGESKNDNENNSGTEQLSGVLYSDLGTPPRQYSNASTHSRGSVMSPASPTAQSDADKTNKMERGNADDGARSDINNPGQPRRLSGAA